MSRMRCFRDRLRVLDQGHHSHAIGTSSPYLEVLTICRHHLRHESGVDSNYGLNFHERVSLGLFDGGSF
jgi:hypothetical protein